MKFKLITLLVVTSVYYGFAQENETVAEEKKTAVGADDKRFEVSKQLDIFNAIVKETEMFYVDTIDIAATMRRGINSMLGGLDPYTEYYPEENMNDLKFLATGEYGGIGALIRYREGGTVIIEPYAGSPAAEAGIKAGDQIIQIDTADVTDFTSDKVSERLKGVQNTKVFLKVKRPGEKKPLKFNLIRKQIVIDQVTYYGVLDDNVGYIYLKGFTDKSAPEVKSAFEDLKSKGIQSLILDIRDNGGGALESAVQIVNLFVPKGREVISMRGKMKSSDRIYRTLSDPIDTVIPLVVMINGGSASASEIVSGSLQDMDRAVLVGQRSFGKGLVQSTRNLPYDGKLKVTIAKYYIPSGRCIQQLDYSHRNADGSVAAIPDSLTKVFLTANGRPVRDGGGIRPDIEVEEEKMPTMLYYLYADNDYVVFDYVNEWVAKHKNIAPVEKFEYSDADYEEFKKYAIEKDFKYDRQSEKALKNLKEVAEFEGYLKEDSTIFNALEEKLKPNLARDLDLYKEEIKELIAAEIVKRYYYQRGELQQNLKNDKALEKAKEVLKNKELYAKTLTYFGKEEKVSETTK